MIFGRLGVEDEAHPLLSVLTATSRAQPVTATQTGFFHQNYLFFVANTCLFGFFLMRISYSHPSVTAFQCPESPGNAEISCCPHPLLQNTSLPAKHPQCSLDNALRHTGGFLEMSCADPGLGADDPFVSLPTQSIPSSYSSPLAGQRKNWVQKWGWICPVPKCTAQSRVFHDSRAL